MFKNYIKTALRNISRHRVYSVLNIIGLASGMAVFVLILLYVQYEMSFDRYHENAKQIYRVVKEDPGNYYLGSNQYGVTPAPLAPTLMTEYPEVLSATRIKSRGNILVAYGEKNFLEEQVHFCDPQTFEIFTFDFLRGNPQTVLQDPLSIIISEKMADKYFGDQDPVGKILEFNNALDFAVTGVFADMPENSHFTMEFIVPFESITKTGVSNLQSWSSNSYYTYFLLQEGADADALEAKFPALIDKHAGDNIWSWKGQKTRYFLQALTKIHLYSNINFEISANSDIKYIYIFTSIAFLILIIACINYMNLATARSAQRAKEVGMRKVVGALRSQLIRQFLGESIVLAIISLLVTVVIVVVSLPVFSRFVERELSFNVIENLPFLLGILAVVLFVGLFAGSYPALYMSSFRPVSVLKGAYSRGLKGSRLRNVLVVTQFVISITLIISTVVVRNQLHFVKNKEMGYSREQIIVLTIHDRNLRKRMETLKTELKRHPNISQVSSSESLPNHISSETLADWPGKPEDVDVPIYNGKVDYDFVDLFEIAIVAGRNFSREFPDDANGAILLNETAVKALGWDLPLGRELYHWGNKDRPTGKVVGIMKDFHMHSLHLGIKPLYIFLNPDYHRYLSIKVKTANLPQTIGFIEEKLKEFSPQYPFAYQFFDDIFDRAYRSERRIGTMFSVFSLMAILIACLGLFGLASFTAQQRTQEIGIRKVLGASASDIAYNLSQEFSKWVVMANVIAWPVAYFMMNRWLQSFAYRIHIGIFTFVFAGVVALMIAILTVSLQTIKAATANPVDALRYE
jgi:putative ABC transport system permease protein